MCILLFGALDNGVFNLSKIPHAFQQWLSYEKTPTLCHAIPAFEAMLNIWGRYQQSHPETADIVENGLDKLRDYIDRLDNVPAYTIAMGNLSVMVQVSSHLTDHDFVDSTWPINQTFMVGEE